MSQVSKKKLGYFVSSKISDQFVDTLIGLNSKNDAKKFISELFTENEKIIFTKRLAATVMLKEGYSNYRVVNYLHLSSSTVFKISKAIIKGEYSFLEELFSNKKARMAFLKKVLYISRAGLPMRVGENRWKLIDGKQPDQDINIR